MNELEKINKYSLDIESLLRLKTPPIGVKFIKSENEIPENALRPKRDKGIHLAQCQAFAMSRREGETVAILKEDQYCWAPLVAYGLASPDVIDAGINDAPDSVKGILKWTRELADALPSLPTGEYIGILSAPLNTARFIPDVILIYFNNGQLRSSLMALKFARGEYHVDSDIEPFDSCVYSVVPVFLSGNYRVTFPDPGEYERALTDEDRVIFSIPVKRLDEFIEALRQLERMGQGYTGLKRWMQPDFTRPEFYEYIFKNAGLDVNSKT
jgi:uncharacterized protein (DUF169 family)